MKLRIYTSLLLVTSGINANFLTRAWDQLQASRSYAAADYQRAGSWYTAMLQDDPYDPEVNYNMGLVLYHQKKYDEASCYFERAAGSSNKEIILKEHALFNLGNSRVEQKKLHEAMSAYVKVLEMNPKNERARHNLEYVKKLLQEQSSKNQDNQQQDKDQQGSQGQQQGNSDTSQDSSKEKSQPQSSQDGAQQDQRQQSSQDQSQGSDRNKAEDQAQKNKPNSDKQKAQESSKKDLQDSSADQLEKSKKQEASSQRPQPQEKSSASDDQGSGQGQLHDAAKKEDSLSAESLKKDAQRQAALQDLYADQIQQKPEDDQRLDERAVMIMQKMQRQEDYLQKQLLKMNVSQSGAGGYGQKNW